MLGTLLFWTFPISTVLHVVKNNAADNSIKRSGLIITSDERSISEQVISFLKEYAYLVVPVYNVVKSFKKFIKSDSEYAKERLTKLREYGRIESKSNSIVKKENTVEVKKDETKDTQKNIVKEPKKISNFDNLKDKYFDNEKWDPYKEYTFAIEFFFNIIESHDETLIRLSKKTNLSEKEKQDLKDSKNYISLIKSDFNLKFQEFANYVNECNNIDELNYNLNLYKSKNITLHDRYNKLKSLDKYDLSLNTIARKNNAYNEAVKLLNNRINALSIKRSRK